MTIQHLKEYGVYHWDTFDNSTILIDEFDKEEDAINFVKKKYKKRICINGADRVDIVNSKGQIIDQINVC